MDDFVKSWIGVVVLGLIGGGLINLLIEMIFKFRPQIKVQWENSSNGLVKASCTLTDGSGWIVGFKIQGEQKTGLRYKRLERDEKEEFFTKISNHKPEVTIYYRWMRLPRPLAFLGARKKTLKGDWYSGWASSEPKRRKKKQKQVNKEESHRLLQRAANQAIQKDGLHKIRLTKINKDLFDLHIYSNTKFLQHSYHVRFNLPEEELLEYLELNFGFKLKRIDFPVEIPFEFMERMAKTSKPLWPIADQSLDKWRESALRATSTRKDFAWYRIKNEVSDRLVLGKDVLVSQEVEIRKLRYRQQRNNLLITIDTKEVYVGKSGLILLPSDGECWLKFRVSKDYAATLLEFVKQNGKRIE